MMLTALASLVLTTNPTLLVLNKAENTVWLRDLKTEKITAKLATGPNPNEVAVSPDQKTAVISDMGSEPKGKTLTFVDIATAKVTKTVTISPHEMPHGVTWLSNDKIVFTSHATDSICEWDVKAGKLGRVIPTEQKGTHLAVLNSDQSRLYSVNAFSGSVTAIDFKAGKILAQIPTGNRAEGISISPDGTLVACGNLGADSISIIDTKSLKVSHTITTAGVPIRTLFTADQKHLVVSNLASGTLDVYDTKTWKKTHSVELKQKPIANPQYGNQWPAPMNLWNLKNGNLLVVLVTSHAVAEIDAKTWKVVRTLETGGIPDGIAVSEPL
jgi:YVTN family beta-propeller protein